MAAQEAKEGPGKAAFRFGQVTIDRLAEAYAIETAGYPADEAATHAGMQLRIEQAGDLFLGAFDGAKLVGYICGTRTRALALTHDSMGEHVPDGETVCLHSVCVAEPYHRKGIASGLLVEYLHRLRTSIKPAPKRAALIAHKELVPLYEKVGFASSGVSPVVHGSLPWHACGLDL